MASHQNGEQHAVSTQPTLTALECQEDGSFPAGYKHPDLQTAISLNTIREVANLIDLGVPPNFVPGLVSKLAQASAEVITWLVREED